MGNGVTRVVNMKQHITWITCDDGINPLRPEQYNHHFAKTFLNAFYWKNFINFDANFTEVVGPVDKSSFIQVMAVWQAFTWTSDDHFHQLIYASLGLNGLLGKV